MTAPADENLLTPINPKPLNGLMGWLTSQKLAITIMSAMTVLAGFVINQGLDEPVKDLLSKIKFAEQAANHASESAGTFRDLSAIASDVSLVKTKLIDERPVDPLAIQLANLRAARIQALTLIGANIMALHEQIAILPRSFRNEEANFESDYQTLFLATGSAADQSSIDELTRFSDKWTAIADRSRQLEGRAIQEMENLRERSERLHSIYLWLTYLSFFLGWIVGLISNVASDGSVRGLKESERGSVIVGAP